MDEDSENLPMATNVNVKDTLTSLSKTNKLEKDRLAAYSFLSSSLESQKDTSKIIQQYLPQLFKYLSRDLLGQEQDIITVVTKIILYCVKDKLFLESVTKDEALDLLNAILKSGKEKQSEDVTKRLLSILGQQRFPSEILGPQITAIIDTLEFIYTEGKGKTLYCVGIMDILISLHTTMPHTISHHAQRWSRMVFSCLGHPLASIRAKSFDLLKDHKASLCGNSELGKYVLKIVDSDLGKALLSLVSKNPQYAMDVWCFIIDVAGKALHKGATINVMLEIIESGFKGTQESRIVSFKAWRRLIDNFALDQDVISDAKRIRLVMMVLKTNNAKTEAVALEKLKTWWHFAKNIGSKLPAVVEQIIYPLLQFCVGCANQSSQNGCPSPNFALNMSSPSASKAFAKIQSRIGSQQLPSFPSLQKIGFEVISHVVSRLGDSGKMQGFKWTIDPLAVEVFASSTNFVKHSPTVMTCLETLLKSVGSHEREDLVVHIWTSLSAHLKIALGKGGKADCRDVFSAFLSHFHSLVQADCLQPQILVPMFKSTSDFPNKVLSSTLYNTGAGTVVKGCPALLLCEILFMPAFMKLSGDKEMYQSLFSRIVSAGASKQQGALSFIQSVSDILDSASANLASADELYQLWSILAHALLNFITATNEVNQGDALEYNFGCLYAVLMLPIEHQLASKVSQAMCKIMARTWKELYHSFARLSALVANADANTCLEEICTKIMGAWRPEFKDAANLEFLASLCVKMLDCVDFSAVAAGRKQNSFTLSPSKWTKRRQRPLANLHSFVHFLQKMQSESNILLNQLGDNTFDQRQVGSPGCFLPYTNFIIDVYTHLFTHIPGTVVSHVLAVVSSPMSRLFNGKPGSTGSVKIFVPSVMSKLEKLWFDMCNCITGRFSHQYDSSFLATLSPLLEATFVHSRRAIKNQSLTFWSATFSKSVGLTYPESLKLVLSMIKEKTAIVLPGWITIDDNVIAETPFTDISQSQGESQVPAPVLPGFPSPKRLQKGSFLHRDISPAKKSPVATKASPAKIISPKDAKNLFSSRRNISADLNMMSDEDFVVISSPTKKRRVLTEHQKEVLKEKRVLPVMYNNLDASQDTSLMAQLNAESQQESMSCMDVIVIDSQASQGKDKTNGTESQAVKLTVKGNSSSNSTGFTVPKQIKLPIRRRSSRIQEMSNDGIPDDDSCKTSQKSIVTESGKGNQEAECERQHMSVDENPEVQIVTDDNMVLSSLDTAIEIPSESPPSLKSSSSTDDIVDVPAFGMFRAKGSSSNSTQPDVIINSSTSSPKPRRVSLRNIKSIEGEPIQDVTAVPIPTEPELNKGKSPRRVPLQRIHDDKSTDKNGAIASESEKKSDGVRSSPKDKSEQESQVIIVESPKAKGSLDKWLAKNNPPKMARRESPRKKRKLSEVEVTSPVIPVTLVEDTQSPGRVSKPHHESESIAETPVKSDDSPSPAIRSVRKLFADDEPSVVVSSSSAVCETPKTREKNMAASHNIEIIKKVSEATLSKCVDDSDGMENLSQGFVTSVEESLAMAVGSQQEDSVKDTSSSNIQEEMPHSENLFVSAEEAPESSEPLMTMHMPTLASQSKDFGSSISKSDSSSSSRQSSSVESDPKDKLISGSESEFNPSQDTLREECNKTASLRKKAGVRETLASTRTRRSSVKKTDSTDETATKSSSKEKDSSALSMTEKASNNEDQMEIENLDEQKMKDQILIGMNAIEHKETSEKSLEESQSKNESGQPSLLRGEITPVIKSVSENSSSQRCSTTKKKRLMAKRITKQRQEALSTPDVSSIESTEGDGVKSERLKRKATRKLDGRLVASARRKISPAVSPPARSRHVLRMRTKAVKKLSQSPPAKRQRVSKKEVSVDLTYDSSADDDQRSILKQAKSRLPTSESGAEVDANRKEVVNAIEEKMSTTNRKEVANAIEEKKSTGDDSDEDKPLARFAGGKHAVERNSQSDSMSMETPESCTVVNEGSPPDEGMEVEEVNNCIDHSSESRKEIEDTKKDGDCPGDEMTCTEEDIPPGQVAPPMDIEGSDQSTGSDEVFDHAKDSLSAEKDNEAEVIQQKLEDLSSEKGEQENSEESTCRESTESKEVVDTREDSDSVGTKEDGCEEKEETKFVLSDWSPSKSPSCSILRKVSTPSSSERGSRKVSFAEPIVSGESPIREKYHSESLPTSPLICHSYNMTLTRPGSSGIRANRGNNYRRRLETTMKKQVHSNLRQRCAVSPSPSSSPSTSQNSYKATQESQLDSVNPIFPDLVDCKASLDCILPQLTSSLWYRGLCQLMKGRNLHTIGDLSALTEVQVNQMPIRCPKVNTVRDALSNYQSQHGGPSTPRSQSKSIFGNSTPSLEGLESTVVNQEPGTPVSNGATLRQEVTPSSIADEGIKILPSAEKDLSQLSPIKVPEEGTSVSVLKSAAATAEVTQSNSSVGDDESSSSKKSTSIVEALSNITDKDSLTELKGLTMAQLFDVHQKLNNLFGVVVEEMKERSFQS